MIVHSTRVVPMSPGVVTDLLCWMTGKDHRLLKRHWDRLQISSLNLLNKYFKSCALTPPPSSPPPSLPPYGVESLIIQVIGLLVKLVNCIGNLDRPTGWYNLFKDILKTDAQCSKLTFLKFCSDLKLASSWICL